MAKQSPDRNTILVTGPTGNVGQHVVTKLLSEGVQVRALVREPATAMLPEGVDVVRGDLSAPDTLDPAFLHVGSVFLLWPFFSADGAVPVVAKIAEHAGRVVYLSAMPEPIGFWHEIEHLIEESALEWTFLRASGFAANTLGWADQIRGEGVVRWPFGAAARSLIHEADIAAVAVRALIEDGHVGEKYILTGPETVSQREQVRIIGEVIGRPVRWEELPPEQARQELLAEWEDPAFVEDSLRFWASLVDEPEPVTDTVRKVTGVPARTFRDWVVHHADDFRTRTEEEIAEVARDRKTERDEGM